MAGRGGGGRACSVTLGLSYVYGGWKRKKKCEDLIDGISYSKKKAVLVKIGQHMGCCVYRRF